MKKLEIWEGVDYQYYIGNNTIFIFLLKIIHPFKLLL